MGNKNTLGKSLSQETKNKISQSLKKYYKTHEHPNKYRIVSEETKEKLRRRVFSEETKEKMRKNHADVKGVKNPSAKAIYQLDLDDNIIKEYAYATLAAKELHLDLSGIIKCCKGKNKTCGGYKWAYANT